MSHTSQLLCFLCEGASNLGGLAQREKITLMFLLCFRRSFCPSLFFMRSKQGRCPARTPDHLSQRPWVINPRLAAWRRFDSCTRTQSWPRLRLSSVRKEKSLKMSLYNFTPHVECVLGLTEQPSSMTVYRSLLLPCALSSWPLKPLRTRAFFRLPPFSLL